MKDGTIKYKTPLTYYGGKQRIASWIVDHIPEHRIYCEPFFGGGAVFFAKEPSYLEVINDLNDNLINFYLQMQKNFDELAAEIGTTLHSESMFKNSVLIYQGQKPATDIERAVATWVVFNQAINATVRGGWKFDNGTGGSHCGVVQHHFRQNFCPWLKKRLQNVQISCRDALTCIEQRDTVGTFFYLDPPYPGTDQGHYKGYTFDDLESLLELLQNIKGKFALSNYPSSLIDDYASKNHWQIITKTIKKDSNLQLNPTSVKTEVLLMNYTIDTPTQLNIF